MEQVWVRRKNSSAGPSLVEKAREKIDCSELFSFFNSESKALPLIEKVLLADTVNQAVKPGFLVRKVFKKEECDLLISVMPSEGQGYMGPEQIKKLYRGRDVHRYMSHDQPFATLVENRVGHFLPRELDDEKLIYAGISDEVRYLHYTQGGHQACHVDGRETRPDAPDCESRLTIQMYLNDHGTDFTGGELIFFDADMNVRSTYLPQAGDCLIFYQEDTDDPVLEYAHEANAVLSGDKYAARAMVEYRRLVK